MIQCLGEHVGHARAGSAGDAVPQGVGVLVELEELGGEVIEGFQGGV